jgi:hypothetical protein
MGVHGADWAQPVVAKLDEVAGRYNDFKAGKPALSARVKLVPVTYDNVFQELLQQWSNSATKLHDFVTQNGIPVNTLTQWLLGASQTEANFFWSHVVDVLIYRFFEIKKSEVRTRVQSQVVDTLNAEMADGNIVEASVLTHSLGTSVAHDFLAFLGANAIDGSEAFMAKNFRFSNFFIVANVGRVLETNPLVYQSCVKPMSANPNEAYCDRYYNFRHELDPFPAVRAFAPPNWGADYRPTENLKHFHEFNVHDYLHYLDHPAVHIPIIRGLLGPVVDDAERQHALDTYPDIVVPDRCQNALRNLRDELKRLIAQFEGNSDPQTFIMVGAQTLAAVKEAVDACR